MTWLADHAPIVVSLMGGGQLVTLVGVVLVHLRSKRKQSDDVMTTQVAMSMDRERLLSERMARLEAARDVDRLEAEHREHLCEASLERFRHRLRNSEAMFEGMFATLRFAAPDRVGEVLQQYGEDWRARRERWAAEDATGGDLRNAAQAIVSGAELVKDAFARGAPMAA